VKHTVLSDTRMYNKVPADYDDTVNVQLVDAGGAVVVTSVGTSGTLFVHDAILWWPYSMNGTVFGYRYTLKVN